MTEAWPSSVLLEHICRAAGQSDTFIGRFAKPSQINMLATYTNYANYARNKRRGREGSTLRRSAPPSLTMLIGFVDAAVSEAILP